MYWKFNQYGELVILTNNPQCPLKLVDISEEDRKAIHLLFVQDDCWVLNTDWKEDGQGVGYFVVQLENDCDDVFFDHSTAFQKIFEELQCVCTGFAYQNEYGEKDDTNTAYAIWFEKIVLLTLGDKDN